MKKRMKRLLSMMLVFSLMMSLLSVGAYAETTYLCGKAVHTHAEDCWDCEKKVDLICELHAHDENCVHQHGDACYTQTCEVPIEKLTCVKEAHSHSENCYAVHNHVDGSNCEPGTCAKTQDLICE